jgi:hypothetical protein
MHSPSLSPASGAADADEKSAPDGRSKRALQGCIGFVGLGRIGTVMAANLVAAGHKVIVYVRRREQIEQLAALGLDSRTDIADLFECEFVITMLPYAAVPEIVLEPQDFPGGGLTAGMMPSAIHLSMSTISTATTSQLARELAHYGQGYIAAPVFGNPDAARARELFIVAAGAEADLDRCQPIFAALGQQVFRVEMLWAPVIENFARAIKSEQSDHSHFASLPPSPNLRIRFRLLAVERPSQGFEAL